MGSHKTTAKLEGNLSCHRTRSKGEGRQVSTSERLEIVAGSLYLAR